MSEALQLLRRLLEWERELGGWDAPVWADVKRFTTSRPAEDAARHGDAAKITAVVHALGVIVFTPTIAEWLAAHDPKAFEQATTALEAWQQSNE
jgi:hypothetical protein